MTVAQQAFRQQQLSVVAQTEQWIAVSKPPFWLTIAGRTAPGTVEFPVLKTELERQCGPLWTVHRLDRETSGLVLFAKTPEFHREACSWFEQRQTEKRYLCLAQGQPNLPRFWIRTPIEGKASLTRVEIKKKYPLGFLAEVLLETGRRHQIRIHLSQMGFPICGDKTYGGPLHWGEEGEKMGAANAPHTLSPLYFKRVYLHAWRLVLPTGEQLEAPIPKDLEEAIRWLN